eukprot:4488671-Pleurochrysis_carterae.AAC.1
MKQRTPLGKYRNYRRILEKNTHMAMQFEHADAMRLSQKQNVAHGQHRRFNSQFAHVDKYAN